MTQFKPIITNAPTDDILAYNLLIGNKPKTGYTLQDKIIKQRGWAFDCNALLTKIRGE